ncbi:MAG: hypothetical protein HY758_04080 [Nitrospirae bacterium]|nr:hypothetical protein [Nitrospirota bacterium]
MAVESGNLILKKFLNEIDRLRVELSRAKKKNIYEEAKNNEMLKQLERLKTELNNYKLQKRRSLRRTVTPPRDKIDLACNIRWSLKTPPHGFTSMGVEIINPHQKYEEFFSNLH